MYLRCLLFFVAFVLIDASQSGYDGHVVVSVTPSEERQYKLLSSLEENNKIDIWNEIRRNSSVHVMIDRLNNSWIMSLLESFGMKPSLLIDNVQNLLDNDKRSRLAQSRAGVPRDIQTTFHNYDQLTAWLREMAASHPHLATLISIGKTYENRDIWLMKLTSNSGRPKKTAFLDFGIHAREWISQATGAYLINEFLTKYAAGGDAKTILDQWELHIVPMLNPDGYAYSHSRERLWRKNRKPISGSCVGVDLNRNFGHRWNTGGSSAQACSDTFHGGSPMSENEAKALQSYMTNKPWTTYLTFHSYGQWFFTNWGYTATPPANYAALEAKAKVSVAAIRSINGRSYTIGPSAALLYVASGGSEDWTAGTLGITYSYCLELPPTGGYGFVAPASEIKVTGYETFVGVVAYFKTF